MIKRLLVANRGEIAVRIMATAAVLGIETVAVYPADDAACAHVGRADTAVELPGAGPAAYLDADAIIAVATGSGCDTLHPGYGFLSEQPELAIRCARAGVRFVGPGPDALALFGDKTAARTLAGELGVPVLAGTDAVTTMDSASLERASAAWVGPASRSGRRVAGTLESRPSLNSSILFILPAWDVRAGRQRPESGVLPGRGRARGEPGGAAGARPAGRPAQHGLAR